MKTYRAQVIEIRRYLIAVEVEADNLREASDQILGGDTSREIDLRMEYVVARELCSHIEEITSSGTIS